MDNAFREDLIRRIQAITRGLEESKERQQKLYALMNREKEVFARLNGALSELKDMAEKFGCEPTSNAEDRNSEEGKTRGRKSG